MKYTHIIWDFNGTLFDDIDAGIDSVNHMLSERGLKIIETKDEYRNVFKFPIIEYYKDIGFDFDKESFEELAPIWVELYHAYSAESKLQVGTLTALEYFDNKKVSQILLSATEINMLKGQISALGIDKYFEDVMGLDNIHASSKKALAEEWRRLNPDARPLFIGDTEHDAAVAAAANAECILVCNGHQSREKLEKCGCTVCDDLYKVLELVK